MSKAVLVIDMPNSCDECPLFCNYYSDMYCECSNKAIDSPYPENFRQDWCPLREMPEKSYTGKSDYYQWGDWEDGWNTCIDNILSE